MSWMVLSICVYMMVPRAVCAQAGRLAWRRRKISTAPQTEFRDSRGSRFGGSSVEWATFRARTERASRSSVPVDLSREIPGADLQN